MTHQVSAVKCASFRQPFFANNLRPLHSVWTPQRRAKGDRTLFFWKFQLIYSYGSPCAQRGRGQSNRDENHSPPSPSPPTPLPSSVSALDQTKRTHIAEGQEETETRVKRQTFSPPFGKQFHECNNELTQLQYVYAGERRSGKSFPAIACKNVYLAMAFFNLIPRSDLEPIMISPFPPPPSLLIRQLFAKKGKGKKGKHNERKKEGKR